MKKIILFSALFMLSFLPAFSQGELDCTVSVDAEGVEIADKTVFDQLKGSIEEFMNNRQWTSDEFKPEERILCNIVITITDNPGQTAYKATALIQSSRPMYNTNKETIIFKFLDRSFDFMYTPGSSLTYTENIYNDNLTALLSFYAYVILGLDYDSFAKLGGTSYIEKARDIAMNAQAPGGPSWDANSDPNNRGAVILNLNNQQFVPFREGLYKYHRIAMDQFLINADTSRKQILNVLEDIKSVYTLNPSSVVVKNFFNAKVDELVSIYSQGDIEIREKAMPILKILDPLNSEKYNKITQ